MLRDVKQEPMVAFKCNPCHYDCDGKTALAIAAERGNIDIFSVFLEHGLPYHVVDNHGNNPLHIAASMGHIEVARCWT